MFVVPTGNAHFQPPSMFHHLPLTSVPQRISSPSVLRPSGEGCGVRDEHVRGVAGGAPGGTLYRHHPGPRIQARHQTLTLAANTVSKEAIGSLWRGEEGLFHSTEVLGYAQGVDFWGINGRLTLES